MGVNCVSNAEEKIIKKLDKVYGIEKERDLILSYINYVKLKSKQKIDYGNYNMYIKYHNNIQNVYDLIEIVWLVLKKTNY